MENTLDLVEDLLLANQDFHDFLNLHILAKGYAFRLNNIVAWMVSNIISTNHTSQIHFHKGSQ